MAKLIIKKEGEKEVAYIETQFNLGKISDERLIEGKSVIMGVGTESTAKYMKQLAFEHATKENYEAFEEALEQYFMLQLSNMLGVEQSPIKRNREGEIIGLNKEVEIE